MAQKKIALACSVCGSRNYIIAANPTRQERLEVKKFCKYCNKHTLHRETRQGGFSVKFIKSVFKTMKDTTWPTKKEAVSDTATVISTALLFTVFFAIVDFLVQWAVSLIA